MHVVDCGYENLINDPQQMFLGKEGSGWTSPKDYIIVYDHYPPRVSVFIPETSLMLQAKN